MDTNEFLQRDDQSVVQAIHKDKIPDEALLSDECWTRTRVVCSQNGPDREAPLHTRRLELFCKQPDDVILGAIRELEIAADILTDPGCEQRGAAGPPAGPYQ